MSKKTRRTQIVGIKRHFVAQKSWGACWYCGDAPGYMHIDHMTPLCRGGSNDFSNLVLSCPRCNIEKSSRSVEEYRSHKGVQHFFAENPNE